MPVDELAPELADELAELEPDVAEVELELDPSSVSVSSVSTSSSRSTRTVVVQPAAVVANATLAAARNANKKAPSLIPARLRRSRHIDHR